MALPTIMGVRRNFRKGGGHAKKSSHHRVKRSKKVPYNEKNVAKRPPYEEKVAKSHRQYSKKK